MGLGAIAGGATHVTDAMFSTAARALADEVSQADLALVCVFPPLTRIREVSAAIAARVAEVAFNPGLARMPRPDNLRSYIESQMYEPIYRSYARQCQPGHDGEQTCQAAGQLG